MGLQCREVGGKDFVEVVQDAGVGIHFRLGSGGERHIVFFVGNGDAFMPAEQRLVQGKEAVHSKTPCMRVEAQRPREERPLPRAL